MKRLIVKVEVLAGTDVNEAARDLVHLAISLDTMVEANFNGSVFVVTPRSSPHEFMDQYDRESGRTAPPPAEPIASRAVCTCPPDHFAGNPEEEHADAEVERRMTRSDHHTQACPLYEFDFDKIPW